MKYLHGAGRKTRIKDGELIYYAVNRITQRGGVGREVIWNDHLNRIFKVLTVVTVYFSEEDGRYGCIDFEIKEAPVERYLCSAGLKTKIKDSEDLINAARRIISRGAYARSITSWTGNTEESLLRGETVEVQLAEHETGRLVYMDFQIKEEN